MNKIELLLAEDDPAMVELLRWIFEREGFRIRHTASGEEALLLAAEAPPDLVILDWMLEELSGIEVCRRLRRAPETANVPVIMLTARVEEFDRVRALDLGADDYVTKP
ncbi:MAG: response regulator, partial [Allosphingosinicella sp.]